MIPTPYTVTHHQKEIFPYRPPKVTGGAMHAWGMLCRMHNIRTRNRFMAVMRRMAEAAATVIFDEQSFWNRPDYSWWHSRPRPSKPVNVAMGYNLTT